LSKVSQTIKRLIEDRLENIHTALPAKIKKYNAKTMYAEVTLLNKKELEGEKVAIPPIIEVPVAHTNAGKFIIRQPYEKGDIVQVLFNERALDKLLITGKSEEVNFTRRFSYDDAVVIRGLKVEQEDDLPNEELDSLYISNLEKDMKMFFNPDGTFKIARKSDKIDVEFVIEKDGIIKITDNNNNAEIKFDVSNTGNIIAKIANNFLLGGENADDAAVLLSKLQTLVSEIQGHSHGGNVPPPTTTFTTDLGSEEVFLRK